jgi:serine/threonine protein kinase
MQQKNENFTEAEIFHWFVQICMALEYVHGRRVIHRDIKTQNVFLTGSKTIKVGDFGISKVLESTTQCAMTVVGTPYYMAPESCQSEPYTSKSDVWALGIILYELCTLKQPFQADNLLGLVFKIVQDEPEPIPDMYSAELGELVKKMMTKNPA